MDTVVAVDGGKSALRLAVLGPDGRRDGTAAGFTYRTDGRAGGTGELAGIVAAVTAALRSAGHRGPVHALCAGLTGMPGDAEGRRALRALLADALPGTRVLLADDVALAHAGALNGTGAVLCAGTGAIALAVGPDGRYDRADGWGPLLGDRGGGYEIGRAGLRAAFAAHDGAGPPTVLADDLPAWLGEPPGVAAVQRVHRDPAPTVRVAAFAVRVAAAAAAGDPVARRIWRDAVADLAATAVALCRRLDLPGAPVSWSGRVFEAGPALTGPLGAALSDAGLRPSPPAGGPLEGGLALAAAGPDATGTPYGRLVRDGWTR